MTKLGRLFQPPFLYQSAARLTLMIVFEEENYFLVNLFTTKHDRRPIYITFLKKTSPNIFFLMWNTSTAVQVIGLIFCAINLCFFRNENTILFTLSSVIISSIIFAIPCSLFLYNKRESAIVNGLRINKKMSLSLILFQTISPFAIFLSSFLSTIIMGDDSILPMKILSFLSLLYLAYSVQSSIRTIFYIYRR